MASGLRPLVVVLMFFVALTGATSSLAEEGQSPSVSEARDHFMRGVELFQNAEHEAALAEFFRANELAPHYGLLYNIGLVQAHLQDYPAAVEALDRYLSEGGDEIQARRQTEVRQLLRRFRRHVGRIRVTVVGPESAPVYIDETEVGQAPLDESVAVTVGQRTVEVRAEGFLPFRRSVIVAGGADVEVRAEMIRVEAQMGAIVVAVSVSNATVTLDGEEVGVSPLEGPIVASPGRHVVEASRSGYDTEGRSVEVIVGEVAPLEISLRPLGTIPEELAGELEIEATEDAADILLDGVPYEGGAVPIGPHVVEVRLEGFQPWWGEIEVEQGELSTVEATLRPTEGFLERYRRRARIFWAVGAIAMILGVATFAADIAVYSWNSDRHEVWEAESFYLDNDGRTELEDDPVQWRERWEANNVLNQSLKQWNVAMWAMLASGIAVVGAGIAILAVAPRPRRYLNLSFAPSPGGFALGLSFSFM